MILGVRHYGKDFYAISQLVGTKNTTQVKTFFSTYRRRYNLDSALAEYEMEHKNQTKKTRKAVKVKKYV